MVLSVLLLVPLVNAADKISLRDKYGAKTGSVVVYGDGREEYCDTYGSKTGTSRTRDGKTTYYDKYGQRSVRQRA